MFSLEELNERVVELVIASTPLDTFRHSLLEKPSGYTINEMLEEGRRHEAVAASTQCLQTLADETTKQGARDSATAQQAVDAILRAAHAVTVAYRINLASALPTLTHAKLAATKVTGQNTAGKPKRNGEGAHQANRLTDAAANRVARPENVAIAAVLPIAVVPKEAASTVPQKNKTTSMTNPLWMPLLKCSTPLPFLCQTYALQRSTVRGQLRHSPYLTLFALIVLGSTTSRSRLTRGQVPTHYQSARCAKSMVLNGKVSLPPPLPS